MLDRIHQFYLGQVFVGKCWENFNLQIEDYGVPLFLLDEALTLYFSRNMFSNALAEGCS